MAKICSGCRSEIQNLKYMSCSKCGDLCDLPCLNLSVPEFNALSADYKKNWSCPSCTSNRPKGDNSNTPVRSTISNDLYSDINVNTKRGSNKKVKTTSELAESDTSILTEIRLLRQEFAEVRIEFKDNLESVSNTLNDKLGELTKTIEAKNHEIAFLKTSVSNLQRLLTVHEQNSMKNELEIVGMPEYDSENLMQVATRVCKKVGVDLNEQDVDEVIRVGPKNMRGGDSSGSGSKWPRPIVVKMLRKRNRDEVLKAAKSRRNLTSEHVVEGPPKNVYINERLSKENRNLFREARQRCQKFGFKYCWIRNGAVHIRQSENRAAIRLQSIEDLDQKIGYESDGFQFKT